MKKTALFISLLAVSVSCFSSDELLISTGRERGSYYTIQGPKIVKYLQGVGLPSTFVESQGSLDNLNKVASGERAIGIAQADAIMFFKKTHPKEGINIEIGGRLGEECVFLVTNKKTSIRSDADIQQKGVSIAVGAEGDGSQATWEYMKLLEENFKNASEVEQGGVVSLTKVLNGQTDSFMFVTSSNTLSTNELFTLTKDNKDLIFIPIKDWDLNNKLPNGDAVYTFKNVVIEEGTLFDKKISTICLNAYTIYNNQLTNDVKEKLSRAFLRMSGQ